jgi:hypothetical protein
MPADYETDIELEASWGETVITIVAAAVTVLVVSLVAVMMAMA